MVYCAKRNYYVFKIILVRKFFIDTFNEMKGISHICFHYFFFLSLHKYILIKCKEKSNILKKFLKKLLFFFNKFPFLTILKLMQIARIIHHMKKNEKCFKTTIFKIMSLFIIHHCFSILLFQKNIF